jgi:hypothetical protein
LVKVTVKFIRRGTMGRKEKETHFLFLMQEMGTKTPDEYFQMREVGRMRCGEKRVGIG